MTTALNTFTSDGFFVIAVPEASVPAQEREDFVSVVKTEWLARQSRMTETDAARLAESVDAGWWHKNRERILGAMAEG
jgi:hypothetical protein